MVDVVCDFDSDKTEFIKRGIIVGWKNVKNQEMLNSTNYYILVLSRYCYSMSCKQYPDIEIATEDEEGKCCVNDGFTILNRIVAVNLVFCV